MDLYDYNLPIISNPFDDSARARQRRMGLLEANGRPDADAIAVLARVYAGLLYDDLCETSLDAEQVRDVCDRFESLREKGDAQKTLLYIFAQYDWMFGALPEPIWWIIGNPALVEPFVEGFVRRLSEFQMEGGDGIYETD